MVPAHTNPRRNCWERQRCESEWRAGLLRSFFVALVWALPPCRFRIGYKGLRSPFFLCPVPVETGSTTAFHQPQLLPISPASDVCATGVGATPGYAEAQPVVFSGLFPTDTDRYPDLRDALLKLQVRFLGGAKSSLGDAKSSLGDPKSSLGDAKSSLGDAKSSLGEAKSSRGDAKSSLGDAKSSLGDA
jgi:hypothetical protein